MINSSSALGESVQLQKQFHSFYAGTSQDDDNDKKEEVRAFHTRRPHHCIRQRRHRPVVHAFN